MSTHQEQPTGTGAPGGDWWSRRPRRSGADRKIAGVASGLGRTFGVDPVLIRVAFVVLTIFGGFGLTLYVLGWLLLPADGDEVSPGEALLGRGRSATPPVLAVGLAVVAAISIMSMFSWGLPFWPLVIAGVVVVLVARNKGRSCTKHTAHGGTPWVDQWAAKAAGTGRSWGEQAEQWVARQPWSGTSGDRSGSQMQSQGQHPAPSPFEQPAFWDEQHPAAADPTRVNLRKDTPAEPAEPTAPAAPPAWDPLGVAPFAWDLPEPAAAPLMLPGPGGTSTSRVLAELPPVAVITPDTLVWVNTRSGVYHVQGSSRFRAGTREGVLSTVAEAESAGYRQAGAPLTGGPNAVEGPAARGEPRYVFTGRVSTTKGARGAQSIVPAAGEYPAAAGVGGTHRMHPAARDLGFTPTGGYRLGPDYINTVWDRHIERYIKQLDRGSRATDEIWLTTETYTVPGTLRLASKTYRVSVTDARTETSRRLFEITFEVDWARWRATPGAQPPPRVTVDYVDESAVGTLSGFTGTEP